MHRLPRLHRYRFPWSRRGGATAALLCIALLLASGIGPWLVQPASVGASASRAATLQIVGPGGSEGMLAALIGGARRRVLLEAFALDDAVVVAALRGAQRRGVDVRVMLDPQGLNSAATLAALQASGIRTRTPNRQSYAVTHMDAVVVDASTVAIVTSALTAGALGPFGRGYMVVDADRFDVLQAASLFFDDWLRRPVHLFGHNLVVVPDSAATVAALIDGAGARLELYTSGLSDPGILSSLRAARGRGVVARVLTQPKGNNGVLRLVAPAGLVRFRDDGAGTVLVVDRHTVLLGSMDLSTPTLRTNRELGVLVGGPAAATLVDSAFFAAFARGVVLAPPPPRLVQHGQTLTLGSLTATIATPQLVRVGGQGVIVVSTARGAAVSVTITYPVGSKPAPGTTAASKRANAHGLFVYRWIVAGHIIPGTALARIVVQKAGTTLTVTRAIVVVR